MAGTDEEYPRLLGQRFDTLVVVDGLHSTILNNCVWFVDIV